MKFEYLIVNIIIGAAPFVASRMLKHTTLPRKQPAVFAIAIVASLFIFIDQMVTDVFWSFNADYILDILLGNIPIEEILFLITVPYTSLFVWESLPHKKHPSYKDLPLDGFVLWSLILSGAFLVRGLLYSASVWIMFGLSLYADSLLKTCITSDKRIGIFLLFIISATLGVNAYLTMRPVLLYNDFVRSPIQIGTIPAENIIYGIALILLTTVLYEYNKKSSL